MKPEVSIILPNYNHSAFLQKRLDSILKQSFQSFEVIILDDASTDDSLIFLEQYKKSSKVSHFLVNKKNTGSPFKQWLKGLKIAKGKYIWIAESDDFCDINFLESQMACLIKNDVAVAKTFSVNKIDEIVGSVNHPIFNSSDNKYLGIREIMNIPIVNISTVLFKKPTLRALNESTFYNYDLIGDLVFYYEFFLNKKIQFNSNTVSYFRQLGISTLNNRDLDYFYKYLSEHIRFVKYMNVKFDGVISDLVKPYIVRRYHKISNRKKREEKLSLGYLKIFMKYKISLL